MNGDAGEYRLVLYVSPSGRRPVQEFLDSLDRDDPDALFEFDDQVAPLVRQRGAALGMPHFRALRPTRFSEIRWHGKHGAQCRIYCTIETGRRVLLLHGVTKRWPKFARNDIQICKQRYHHYCSPDYDPSIPPHHA